MTLTIMRKITAFFLTILFALFPNTTMPLRQQLENDSSVWAPKIIEAIVTEDTAAFEEALCNSIKTNTPNLDKKIQQFFDCIEGEIIDTSWKDGMGTYSTKDNDGDSKLEYSFVIKIVTDSNEYGVIVSWREVDTKNPDETKIRAFGLYNEADENEFGKPGHPLRFELAAPKETY